MSVFDHVYYPFHHDHINTPRKHPLTTHFEFQMVGGVAWKLGGYNPPGGLDKSLSTRSGLWPSRDATSHAGCCVIVGYLHGPTMVMWSSKKPSLDLWLNYRHVLVISTQKATCECTILNRLIVLPNRLMSTLLHIRERGDVGGLMVFATWQWHIGDR